MAQTVETKFYNISIVVVQSDELKYQCNEFFVTVRDEKMYPHEVNE